MKIFRFVLFIAIGVEAFIRGPRMMPELIAYSLGGFLIVISLAGIIATLMSRPKKRWADVTRKI
jgi:hypothetical protein